MDSEATWLLLRVTGIVALAALTVSVASGLVGPAARAPWLRGVLVSTHRSAAATGLTLTVGHVVLTVADPWVDVSSIATVIPGASAWEPGWVGVGAVAVDLLLVVAVTSALRSRAPYTWWTLHVLTYPAWLMATAHALAIGTDAWRAPYLVAGAFGVLLVVVAAALRAATARRGYPAGVPPHSVLASQGASR